VRRIYALFGVETYNRTATSQRVAESSMRSLRIPALGSVADAGWGLPANLALAAAPVPRALIDVVLFENTDVRRSSTGCTFPAFAAPATSKPRSRWRRAES
jgi:hypothetical protein